MCGGILNNQLIAESTRERILKIIDEYDKTRQLSYRKEDRAMRPIYGCSEKF